MLIAVTGADQDEKQPQPATKLVHLGKQQSVPLQVPATVSSNGASFTWSGLMVEVMKGTAVNLGSSLGYELINSMTGNFFGLLDKKPDTAVMEQLKKIEELVRTVDYKIDSLTKDVAKVQISVQLGNVKLWTVDVQGMFDVMNNIFQAAPYQSHDVTKQSVVVLVDEIRRKAYADALGIYNAMVVPSAVEDPILDIVFRYVYDSYYLNTDAFDVYGILRSFSTQYLTPLTQASTLLRYASNATKDYGLLQLALKVDDFIKSWDERLEIGQDPIIPPIVSSWARKVLEGSPDETKIGWNAVFDLSAANTYTDARCGQYVYFVMDPGPKISMRRPPKRAGSWVFATTNGTSAEPECVFTRDSSELVVPVRDAETYWLNVYFPLKKTTVWGSFAVRGYASKSDRDQDRNNVNLYDGRPSSMSRAVSITSMQSPRAGTSFWEFNFVNGRILS
jgi:hypothetical protein